MIKLKKKSLENLYLRVNFIEDLFKNSLCFSNFQMHFESTTYFKLSYIRSLNSLKSVKSYF